LRAARKVLVFGARGFPARSVIDPDPFGSRIAVYDWPDVRDPG
jgi:hypothetical protein